MEADIKIYTLGRVKLEKAGEFLVDGSIGLPKKWYLFMVLFFHSHEILSISYLTEKLGMHDNEAPKQSLRMMVYRLRQDFQDIAGDKQIILTENGGYTFNSDIKVWLDLEQFETLKARGEEQKKSDNSQKAADLFHRAFELYRGPFMEGVDENLWILQQRKKYRSSYLEIVASLTELLQQQEKWQQAEEVLETALQYCPLETELHNWMIEINGKMNNYHQARRRAEQSAAFFQRNGLQVPDKISEHLTREEDPGQVRDPGEFIRENRAMEEGEIVECGSMTLHENFAVMKNMLEQQISLLNFKLDLADADTKGARKLNRAENLFSTVLKDNLSDKSVFCHWQQGHFVVLTAELESGEVETFYEQLIDEISARSDLAELQINFEWERL